MATLCSDKCHITCDFCKHYRFNGEDMDGKPGPIYVDKGCCSLHFMREDPDGGCDYFHCFRANKRDRQG